MRSLLLTFFASTTLISCASTSAPFDELAGESETDDAVSGKADAAVDGAYTYYAIKTDMRRCAAPMCGGFFLERVNRTSTVCVDGKSAASCYTPELDWSETDLDADTQNKLVGASTASLTNGGVTALVRGRFAKTNGTPSPELGRFVVTEAWVAEGPGIADGVFARIKDAGVRCITTPCPSIQEKGLNNSRTANIAGLDWETSGLDERQVAGFIGQMFEPGGFIIAGERYTIHENGQTAKGRTVTQAFHKLVQRSFGGCHIGGCSNQICSEQDGIVSTCEWREEYACYATATCERQADGACGWTETAELAACLPTPTAP